MFGFAFMATPNAQAATDRGGLSVAQACYYQYGWDDTTHGNTAVSWRCIFRGSNGAILYSVDLNKECVREYGAGAVAKYLDYNNPYSWRCYR